MKPLPVAHNKASIWFPFTQPSAQARVRLFCLPYGGGGAWMYRHLSEIMPHDVDVCPIELPGRTTRSNETPITHGPQLVAEIAQAMQPLLDLPYAIFGYSLGALLAFDVARQLRQNGLPLPLHLFVAARRAPHLPSPNVVSTDNELIEELRRLGGTPKEVLENKELLYRSLPCIRADFSMDQKYSYREEPPLACPITVLGGDQDMAVPRDNLETWSVHTTGVCNTLMFPGGHFFLHDSTPQIARVIDAALRPGLRADSLAMKSDLHHEKAPEQPARPERAAELRNFWQRYLADSPPRLTLPSAKRPSRQTSHQARVGFRISQDHTTALSALLGKNSDAPLFISALALYALLLYRHTGQTFVVVGSPMGNHQQGEQNVALRILINPAASFRDLVEHTRQSVVDAFAHKDAPFSLVVDMLQVQHDPSYHPVFQVSFALNAKRSCIEGPQKEDRTSKLDITLDFIEDENGLAGSIKYNTDLFDVATIDRMASHYQTLVNSVVADPERAVGSLEMLTAAERHALLEGIHPRAPLAEDRCIHAAIAAQAVRTPNAPALTVGTSTLTYAALVERVEPLSAQLRALGVGPDVLVGVHLPRSPDLVIAVLAVLDAGGAYLPIDPAYPRERTGLIVEDAAPSVILTTPTLATGMDHPCIVFVDEPRLTPPTPLSNSAASPLRGEGGARSTAPHDLAYVLYTSGSTGRPQGVEIEHRHVASFFAAMDELFHAPNTGVWLAVTSLSFDISVLELLWTLSRGLHVVLHRETMAASDEPEESIAAQIVRHGVTHLQCTPSLARLLVAEPEAAAALGNLREFLVGGEELPLGLARDLADLVPGAVRNMYGPTETTVWSTSYRVPAGCDAVRIGSPLANSRVYVLDANDQLAPIGVTGEIVLGGSSVARGYRGRPEMTAKRFIADPFVPGARAYRTGDLGRMRPDGTLEFLGRRDSQIKLRGHRIELGDVEAALRKSALVAEAAVTVHPDAAGEAALCAYVVPAMENAIEVVAEAPVEHVSTWQALWERTYGEPKAANDDAHFWTAGWISSDTGKAIAADAMREWVDTTVERIRSCRLGRVLEIGCGSGLLLFRLAPHSDGYIAQDFSRAAILHIRTEAERAGLTQVTAIEAPADELSHVPLASVDTVIVNSVVQYFPSANYLFTVLERAVARVRDGGTIFIGDVRDLHLLHAQLASEIVDRENKDFWVHAAELERRVAAEEELLLAPYFFAALPKRLERVQDVRILRKRNSHKTEMARFRYDVVMHVGSAPRTVQKAREDRPWGNSTLATLSTLLTTAQSVPLVLRDVPDARLSGPVRMTQALRRAGANGTTATKLQAADLLAAAAAAESAAVDLDAMNRIAEDHGLHIDVSPPVSGAEGTSDVVLWSQSDNDAPSCWSRSNGIKTMEVLANNPLHAKQRRTLVPRLRDHMQRHLPDYMLPSAFVVLDALPRTPNGKIARKALPPPQRTSEAQKRSHLPPLTPMEVRLAELWSQVLGVEQPGANDHFFDLGGHSFSAVQLAFHIRRSFGRELPLGALFANPCLSAMAKVIE